MEDRCNYCNFNCVLLSILCAIDIYHKSNENTDKYKNQRAAAWSL